MMLLIWNNATFFWRSYIQTESHAFVVTTMLMVVQSALDKRGISITRFCASCGYGCNGFYVSKSGEYGHPITEEWEHQRMGFATMHFLS
jgi:hypothetical protein